METQSTAAIDVAVLSDVGCRRTDNEDSFGFDLVSQLFVVCDGIGGAAGGEVASHAAVEQLLETYADLLSQAVNVEQRLLASVMAANRRVWSEAQADAALHSMGTTLVAACVDGNRIVVANVGDSRAYFLRDDGCLQITQDHSVRAEQLRLGLSGDDHTLAACITRAVGVEETVEPDLFTAELESGDMVLLASDGLTRYADAEALARLIRGEGGNDLASACRRLVATATDAGAADNVTCLLFRMC